MSVLSDVSVLNWLRTGIVCIFAVSAFASLTSAQPRVLMEAEDFQGPGDWAVRHWDDSYFCASFASDFLSRQKCLAAPAQTSGASAALTVDIPETGQYALFARYGCPYMYNCVFTVRIHQRGKLVFERTFGRLQSPKIWPFGGGVQPMATYQWGGGDNMVYEGGVTQFRLHHGRARVTLIAGPQPEPAAERQVDLLMLTPLDEVVKERLAKASYLPLDSLLTNSGEVFLRVANPEGDSQPFIVELTTVEHSPYWVHGRPWRTPLRIGVHGVITGQPAEADYIQPGATSEWAEIGHRLDRLNESTLKAAIHYARDGAEGTDAAFEFATRGADGTPRTARQVRYSDPSTQLIRFAVPGDPALAREIRTAEEELQRLLEYVRSLPDRGTPPRFIGIRGILTSHFTGTDTSQKVKNLVAELQQELVGDALTAGIEVESLGDEIHLRQAPITDETNEAFRACLKSMGLSPADLLPEDVLGKAQSDGETNLWSLVSLDYEGRETNPRIWYHSQVFGYENGSLLELKAKTEQITRDSAGKIRTGANYSPHPYYWPKEQQWVRPFKLGALTMPWSEDYVWGIPQVSPQVTGYLMDVFRCGAKYGDLPIVFYVMPHSPGNTPRSFRLSYYEALAHGARLINNYCVTPIVTAYTENYVGAAYPEMYREIHDVANELGQFDDILFHGKVRPASVALLISGTTDIWDPSPNYNHERQCIYYALRHAGVSVDFITEDDITDGLLDEYKVLYISASHMASSASEKLSGWVAEGGMVFSSAGGGALNEYGEPNAAMLRLFGLDSAELDEQDELIDSKYTLPRLRPVDGLRISLPGLPETALPAIATVQRLVPTEGAQVAGLFHKGSPAAVVREIGEGKAVLIGGFPGAAYISPAIPIRPWDRGTTDEAMSHFLPTEFDQAARDVILWPVREAGVVPDITISEPVVECSVIDSDRGNAIMLINWTGEPIKRLTLTVQDDLSGKTVRSVERGKLVPRKTSDGWQVTLPLSLTDCITIR